ncbi:MAG: hypothetical protein EBV65_02240 [Gammaproteobacteria bacterium]|nr:hypothetical protein [Gammaproteobacteria bacterium]
MVRGLVESQNFFEERLLAEIVGRRGDDLRRDAVTQTADMLGLALLFEKHEIHRLRPVHVHFVYDDAVGFEAADLRAELVTGRFEFGVPRANVVHGDVDTLRNEIGGRRAFAHRRTRHAKPHQMHTALLATRRDQQGLVDDVAFTQPPKFREPGVRALTPNDDLHAEA